MQKSLVPDIDVGNTIRNSSLRQMSFCGTFFILSGWACNIASSKTSQMTIESVRMTSIPYFRTRIISYHFPPDIGQVLNRAERDHNLLSAHTAHIE